MLTSPLLAYLVSGVDGIEPPLARHALQLVDAAVLEPEPGAGDEILDRPRDQHLAGTGAAGEPRADVDGKAGDLAVGHLALAGVDSRPHLEAEAAQVLADRAGALDRAARTVEGGEDAVPGGVDLFAPVLAQPPPDHGVVPLEQLPPGAVAERRCPLGRADEVGEENRREYARRRRRAAHGR